MSQHWNHAEDMVALSPLTANVLITCREISVLNAIA